MIQTISQIDLPFKLQTFTDQIKNSGELTKDKRFVTLLAQSLQHLVKHLHLSTAVNHMIRIGVGFVIFSFGIGVIRPRPFDVGVIAGGAKVLHVLHLEPRSQRSSQALMLRRVFPVPSHDSEKCRILLAL